MFIRQLVIRNTKGLDLLLVDFDQPKPNAKRRRPRVNILFAANGQGKTTILEAVSLLGHLPCMARLAYDRSNPGTGTAHDVMPSLLAERDTQAAGQNSTLDDLNTSIAANLGSIRSLFATQTFRSAVSDPTTAWPLGVSGFFFDIVHSEQGELRSHEVVVVCPSDQSLSTMLSSEEINDLDFQRLALICYASSDHSSITQLLTELLSGRAVDRSEPDSRRVESPRQPKGSPFISYINTDLCDFGRGNDLRESPKSLSEQFVPQMIDRIGIPREENGQITNFKILRDAIEGALYAPIQEVHHDRLVPLSFRLMQLAVQNKKLNIDILRGATRINQGITHISAGENECLFVYLMLLAFRGRRGIFLLDEPDLHLSTLNKRNFFEQLFPLLDQENHQIIIATHSDAILHVLADLKYPRSEIVRLVYTYAPDASEPLANHRTVAEYDPHYIAALLRRRRRNPILRRLKLSISVWLDRIMTKQLTIRSFLWEGLSTLVTLAIGLTFLGSGAVANVLDSFTLHRINAQKAACVTGRVSQDACAILIKPIKDQHIQLVESIRAPESALLLGFIIGIVVLIGSVLARRRRRNNFRRRFLEALDRRHSDA